MSAPAGGQSTQGPRVSTEFTQGSAFNEYGPEVRNTPDAKIARWRDSAQLLAPIPLPLLGGMFVAKGDVHRERRVHSGAEARALDDEPSRLGVAGFGAIYLPHAKEGAPRFFAVASRYGPPRFADKTRPMAEFILGADIADEDMPFTMKFAATDETETRLLVRYRRFPGFQRWLLLVGHKIERTSGWSLDVTLPNHVLLGWQTKDAAWKTYAGVRWISREYPYATAEAHGWIEGHVESRLLGLRRELMRPLYLAVEAGMQKEILTRYDESGETLARHSTRFAPWASVAIETWLSTP